MLPEKPTIQQQPVFIEGEDMKSVARRIAYTGRTTPAESLIYVELDWHQENWIACEVVRTVHAELHVRRK